MADPGLDDVFIDDITVPATDGYPLAATLFLPRGAKRHAVLINSATAVPRKLYRGFAGYLAQRGCAVLTYDYRGTGDSRPQAPTGDKPKSLAGFKASMSDWAALDITAAVSWMRERYKALPFAYVGHSFGGQALGLLPNNSEISRALFIAAQAGYWKLMASPERYRVYAMLNFIGLPVTRALGYMPGTAGLGMDLPKDAFLQWVGWVMSPRYLFEFHARRITEFSGIPRRVARALHVRRSLGDAAGRRIAVLGIYLDQSRDRHGDAGGDRREPDRAHGILQARTSLHAVAWGSGMDRGGGIGFIAWRAKIIARSPDERSGIRGGVGVVTDIAALIRAKQLDRLTVLALRSAWGKPRLTALELLRRVCVQGRLRTGRFDGQFYVHEIDALERVRHAFEATRARSVGIGTRAREDRIFAL